MVVWIVSIISQVFFGYEICQHCLNFGFPYVTQLAFAVSTGFGASTTLFYIFTPILGSNILNLLVVTAIMFFAGFYLISINKTARTKKFNIREIVTIVQMIIYLAVSSYLVLKSYFPSNGGFTSEIIPFIMEDLAIQAAFRSGMHNHRSGPFHMQHPLNYPVPMRSNWLLGMHSTMMQIGFSGFRFSIVVPSIMLLTSFAVLMNQLSLEFQINRFLSFLSPFFLVLLGSYEFFDLNVYPLPIKKGKMHPVFHLLLGCRSTAYSLTISLTVFLVFIKTSRFRGSPIAAYEYIGLVVGCLLPVIQYQAFVGMSVYIFIMCAVLRFKKELRSMMLLYFVGFTLHLPIYLRHPNTLLFEPIYKGNMMGGSYFPFLKFWYVNYGLFPIIILIGGWFVLKNHEIILFIPSFICFFIFSFIKLQSFAEMNFVAYNSFFFILAIPVFLCLMTRMFEKSKNEELRGAVATIGFLFLVFSCADAAIGVYKNLNNVNIVWNKSEYELVEWIKKNTKRKSVIYPPDKVLNCVSALTGRPTLLNDEILKDIIGFVKREKYPEGKYLVGNSGMHAEQDKWRQVYSNEAYVVYECINC